MWKRRFQINREKEMPIGGGRLLEGEGVRAEKVKSKGEGGLHNRHRLTDHL